MKALLSPLKQLGLTKQDVEEMFAGKYPSAKKLAAEKQQCRKLAPSAPPNKKSIENRLWREAHPNYQRDRRAKRKELGLPYQ